jgi:hypothetical protein
VITAIVMITTESDRIPEVAEAIADVVAGRLSKVPGVLHTDTHVAFRAYSRHDLEATFSIGLE